MSLPRIVSQEEWTATRRELLEKEKDLTRQRDRLNTERRDLPMVEVTKPYDFEGPNGRRSLLDLFEGRPQLIVYRLGGGLPELQRRHRRAVCRLHRAPQHAGHHLRPRVPRPSRQARAVEDHEGLDHPLVLHQRR